MKDEMKTNYWKPGHLKTPKRTVPSRPVNEEKQAAYRLPPVNTPKITIHTPDTKSANMFYTKPVKGGTISNVVKSTVDSMKPTNYVKPAAVKPAVSEKPKSLEQIRNEMEAQQKAIADLDRKQYNNMLNSGGDHDRLEALKAQREAALKELKEAYSNAMGLGEKKPKNQLQGSRMDDVYRQAILQRMGNVGAGQQVSGANGLKDMQQSNEQLFWDGFKKGLGLKEGEEVGEEATNISRGEQPEYGNPVNHNIGGGRPGGIGFSAHPAPMHAPGLDDEEASQDSGEGGQFSSFVYGYSEDNPLLDDPKVDDNVYITEEEYNDLKQELDDILEGRNGETGAQASYQDIYMQLMKLEENRKWSQQIEEEDGLVQNPETSTSETQASITRDPATDEHVYITEAEFETLLDELKRENNWSGGPIPGATTLIENRVWSEGVEEFNNEHAGDCYMTEEEAAVAFAEQEVPNTGNDYLERGAVIIHMAVPVMDANGNVTMEERYLLEDTFIGEHDNVINGLISTYIGLAPALLLTGATISFVHTHPYCTGHEPNEFSGDEGDTAGEIIGEALKRILSGEGLSNFGDYLGDQQVPWLPGVERMYLASPDRGELYACDKDGPIMDPNNPNKYLKIDTFTAKITGTPYPG
jgi:hypothetical protein